MPKGVYVRKIDRWPRLRRTFGARISLLPKAPEPILRLHIVRVTKDDVLRLKNVMTFCKDGRTKHYFVALTATTLAIHCPLRCRLSTLERAYKFKDLSSSLPIKKRMVY